MKPLIDSLPKIGGGCSSCGGNAEAIRNLMENKLQTFVVQVVVEAEDGLAITREALSKGKVLSVTPQKQQPQSNVTFTPPHATTERRVFPAQPALNG